MKLSLEIAESMLKCVNELLKAICDIQLLFDFCIEFGLVKTLQHIQFK